MNGGAQKLYQRIAAELEAAIVQGRFAVDARLPGEREMAEEFKVSRPTIREAMIALEIRGLVESRHGSGVYVRARHAADMAPTELDVGAFELVEARRLFEGEATALAAATIGEGELDRLASTLDAMAEEDPTSAAAYEADKRFHLLIAEATGNSLVRSAVETLWTIRKRSPLCIHMFTQAKREGVNPRVDEHRLILHALRARDPNRARDAMHEHLRRVTDDILAATELALIEQARKEAAAQRHRISSREVARNS